MTLNKKDILNIIKINKLSPLINKDEDKNTNS